jgi:hypothetical protein
VLRPVVLLLLRSDMGVVEARGDVERIARELGLDLLREALRESGDREPVPGRRIAGKEIEPLTPE